MSEETKKGAEKSPTDPRPPKQQSEPPKSHLQLAVDAIASKRANDNYTEINGPVMLQYKNSNGRLIVSVNKSFEKDPLGKSRALLSAYKNFSNANVLSSGYDDEKKPKFLFVTTTDGEKYQYDLTANALIE